MSKTSPITIRQRLPAGPLTIPPQLRADCSACSGLCCVALPFDADQGFGFDKPAHVPCRHLSPDFQCSIHSDLARHGFSGCVSFDCHGAGQRTTRLFEHSPWSQSQAPAETIFAAFFILRHLHELALLAHSAHQCADDPALKGLLQSRMQALEHLCGSDLETLQAIDLVREREALYTLLAALRG